MRQGIALRAWQRHQTDANPPPLYASHYHTLRPGRITDYVHVAAVAQPAARQEEKEEEYLPHQQAVNFNK